MLPALFQRGSTNDSSVSQNNPAGRTYCVLHRAKNSGKRTFLEAFAHALEIPSDKVTDVFLNLGLLGAAIDEVAKQLERVGATETLKLYSESVPHLKSAISLQQLGTVWESARNLIRDEDLRALRFCSKELALLSPEEALSDDQIKELKTDVDELYESVFKSTELETELKQVILGHLDSILQAIHHYRVKGLRPIAEALTITAVTLDGAAKKQKRSRSRKHKVKTDQVIQHQSLLDSAVKKVKKMMVLIKFGKLVWPWAAKVHEHWPQITDSIEKIEETGKHLLS
jgi:hypothetical protein